MKNHSDIQILCAGKTHFPLIKKVMQKIGRDWQIRKVSNLEIFDKYFKNEAASIIFLDQDSPFSLTDLFRHPALKTNSYRYSIIVTSQRNEFKSINHDFMYDILEPPVSEKRLALSLHNAGAQLLSRQEILRLKHELELQSQEMSELNNIGIALSAERDPDALLNLILQKSREITNADAGSLYLVEKIQDVEPQEGDFFADKQLRFKLSHNDSIDASYNEFVIPIQKRSMAGYVALTGNVLNIEDAYKIPKDAEFSHDRSFDQKMGYRTKSILGIPMCTHKGETIGVLQLINRKQRWRKKLRTPEIAEHEVCAFDERCVTLASSLASQAAVSIDNARLYEEIKRLFEGFIRASVHAIEQRDPTTSGHSERVAALTVGLAEKVDGIDSGRFKNTRFSKEDLQQIKYAGLLHDFGKIGVREHVLVKAKKLYPAQLDAIKFRFKFIKRAIELQLSRKQVKYLLKQNREAAFAYLTQMESGFKKKLEEIDRYLEFIIQANEPKVLAEGGFDKLKKIGVLVFEENGTVEHYLTEQEIKLLSIAKGSLSDEERREIESHVTHTFNFLSKIPWTSELKKVPDIAHAHHEKLDGSGYPLRLGSDQIPVQSKMMTIADIYDALTAWDRPYKKAVPTDRALQILQFEVNDGKLDADLYRIFLEAEIYRIVKRPKDS